MQIVFLLLCVGLNYAQIKHVILSSDRFRLFFFHFSIVMCFFMTKSVTLTCCTPLILVGARYYYSRKVIQSYLDCALHTDMADIEAYYMTPTGKTRTITNPSSFCQLCDAPAPESFFFLFPTFRSSTESPSNIGHPSSSHPSSLLPPSPTRFLSESHQSWDGRGWRGGVETVCIDVTGWNC